MASGAPSNHEKKAGAEPHPCLIVALLSTGETVRREGDEPADFVQLVSNSTISWIDYASTDLQKDLPRVSQQLGFSGALVSPLMADPPSDYEDLTSELGVRLPAVKVKEFDVQTSPLVVLLRENLVFTVHTAEIVRMRIFSRYAEIFMRKIPLEASPRERLTLVLARLVDENNTANFDHLREIEEQGDYLSKELMDTQTPPAKLGPEIYKMKHALIEYLGALWATVDVLNALRYGDAELLSDDPKILQKLAILVSDVNQQINLAEHLSDVLASGLEVLQSIYNNQLQALNNRLALVTAYLTILGTAALVPNTIATILSNSAFAMTSSDIGWYMVLLALSTLASTYLAYRWAKRRGLLTKIT
jgi:magnesium transporter